MPFERISTDELLDFVNKQTGALLDVRPVEAYNGWRLQDEPRGGHIKTARTFPAAWTRFDDWPKLLKDKQIDPSGPVVIYGYGSDETERMAKKFSEAGLSDLRIYDTFSDWSAETGLPMSRLDRYTQLVYPDWLNELLSGKTPLEFTGNDYVVCHASYGYRKDYEDGHIPGAIYMDTLTLESPETWNRRSPGEIEEALCSLGITAETTVIMYGHYSHPNIKDERPGEKAGHLASIRCAAILLWAGVKDVRVLNGGLDTWRAAGYEVTTDETERQPVKAFGAKIPGRPELMVDTPRAKEMLASNDAELVSVRAWEEYIGDRSGYNYMDKVGRIPGAVFGNSGSDAYHMENYRNIDHTLREYHEVAANWKAIEVVPQKHVAFYCGTGWRASEAFLHAYLMSWPRVSVYDGGWFEWSADPDNPIETGVPE